MELPTVVTHHTRWGSRTRISVAHSVACLSRNSVTIRHAVLMCKAFALARHVSSNRRDQGECRLTVEVDMACSFDRTLGAAFRTSISRSIRSQSHTTGLAGLPCTLPSRSRKGNGGDTFAPVYLARLKAPSLYPNAGRPGTHHHCLDWHRTSIWTTSLLQEVDVEKKSMAAIQDDTPKISTTSFNALHPRLN